MATDTLNRFIFDNLHVRGELVQLEQSYASMVENHNYPAPVQHLLGELMAATALVTATLKFEGEISVQIQGDALVRLASIQSNHNLEMRGVARLTGEVPADASFEQLVGKGMLLITITPDKGERYQGVVALDKPNLAACLEEYFSQSEQLPTRLWLFTQQGDTPKAGGAFLQVLPGESATSVTNDFEHVSQLANTLSQEELFSLDAEQILHRLYHQEDVRLFAPSGVKFVCGCSRERCEGALLNIGKEGIREELDAHGQIEMKCEYCMTQYVFKAEDLEHLWAKPH